MPIEPPRGPDGRVIPHDHLEILDEHYVIRWTTANDVHPIEARLISGAFSESSEGGMSVDIEDWIVSAGLDRLHNVPIGFGAVRLNVGALRGLGFQVGWDPVGSNPYHGAVWGIGNGSGRRRKILAIAERLRSAKGEI
jgi:hypothetical protein